MTKSRKRRHPTAYALCFTSPLGPVHYVGISTDDRIARRLYEHVNAKGCPTTRAILQHGGILAAVSTWDNGNAFTEPFLAALIREENYCPACDPDKSKNAIWALAKPYAHDLPIRASKPGADAGLNDDETSGASVKRDRAPSLRYGPPGDTGSGQ